MGRVAKHPGSTRRLGISRPWRILPAQTAMAGDAKDLARRTTELRDALANADSGARRLDLVLSSPDARALVRRLPDEDLYLLIKDIGVASGGELVALASALQFRTFLDLDSWKKDRFEAERALAWIIAARTGGLESLDHKVRGLDLEVLELVLRSTTRVHALGDHPDPEVEGVSWRTPDGQYLVEFAVEGAEMEAVRAILDRLYGRDPIAAARLIEACRWDLPSELEETALRFRNGRLADLGFPDLAEALSYLAYRDPDAPLVPEPVRIPAAAGFYLAPLAKGSSVLDQVLLRLSPEAREKFVAALPLVLNAVLVFEAVEVGDPEEVRRAMQGVRDTLSLGLEHAAAGDIDRAVSVLGAAPLKEVFRAGVSVGLELRYRADRLLRGGFASFPGSRNEPLFDTPLGEAIVALRRRRPLYSPLLDGPTARPAPRSFRSRDDVERVRRAIDSAEKLARAFQALGFEPASAEAAVRAVGGDALMTQVRYSDLFLTVAARDSVGQGLSFAALPRDRVKEALERAFEVRGADVHLRTGYADRLRAVLANVLPGEDGQRLAREFVDHCARRLLDEIGRPFAAAGAIDPKIQIPWLSA